MNNRKHNSKNPYQGTAKKVLCICSAGLLRSPTAAIVLQQEYGYNTRACGIDAAFALIPFDDVLAYWADEIVVMDHYQAEEVPQEHLSKVLCLGIKDNFEYMDKHLQKAILDAYKLQTLIKENS